jgi:hypothetical protein
MNKVEVYVLLLRNKKLCVEKLEDSAIKLDYDYTQIKGRSKVVLLTKKLYQKGIITLVDNEFVLRLQNNEYFDFLNDNNIIYFNIWGYEDSKVKLKLHYQADLFT